MGGHTVRRAAERAGAPVPADDATLRAEGEGAGAQTSTSGEGSSGAGTHSRTRGGGRTEAARRRAAQRAARISAGTEELEQRLADLLRGGLAGAEQAGYAPWEEIAARMVDSQAPGLAARVRGLGSVAGSGEGWPERLLAECALLHLLARAWEGRDALPTPLAETVRTRVGLTVGTSELLADGDALLRDEWLVLAQRDTEEGRLTARRIWLYGRATGRSAMLLSFAAGGRAPETELPVGAVLDAELAYYPGGSPLRAALGERHGAPLPGFRPTGGSIPEALETYARALHGDPWLEGWPYVLRDVVPIPPSEGGASAAGPAQPRPRTATGWQLASDGADVALPVAPETGSRALWKLLAMSADGPLTVFGECGHHGFTPHTAWFESRPVTL
ncbi:SWIM zinc finger family protein [Streptomyces reniochalinae]|uniref:SWIM zinc finger family protein n=1 Tax=Streptomyces reniochalinae TaxID=2250578 RepID=A0A367EN64_9ACTN|nr:SWIM zinc finger family protein [Streptomyces reniochalinae]RCG19413.1 SWIM zinc finger family protein [Streptomyces reniochalinae]